MRTVAARKGAGTTNVNIIPAAAGQYVVIDGLAFTASAAGTVKLVNSISHGDVLPTLNILENGNFIAGKDVLARLRSAVNEGLDITITGGNVTYIVSYHYEP